MFIHLQITNKTMLMLSTSSLQLKPYRSLSNFTEIAESSFRKNLLVQCCSIPNLREQKGHQLQYEETFKRRRLLIFLVSVGLSPTLPSFGKTKVKSPFDEKRIVEQNKRIQRENNAPEDFPSFVREGFEVKVVAPDNYVTSESGLIYKDFEVGKGDHPKDGQQVIFHYIGYNESGRRIDSTYIQGFEQGIIDMRPGGKRRIIIPPELGPPVGPSTFFSSKQFEVFDVELISVQDCQRRTIGFYSDVVCT